jgi:hypothetical protein
MPGGGVQIKLGKKGKAVYNNAQLTLQEGFTKIRSIVERDRGGDNGGKGFNRKRFRPLKF